MLRVCSCDELNAFVIPKHRAVEHQVIIFPVAPLLVGKVAVIYRALLIDILQQLFDLVIALMVEFFILAAFSGLFPSIKTFSTSSLSERM